MYFSEGIGVGVIAIFCDGTWNSPTISMPTHVYKLYAACAQTDDQRALYFEGVGTGGADAGAWGKLFHKFGGGLFGWGLNRNIKEAYLALCQNYRAGDKIMIFGFSRGAYTARSLAGMIRKCGILETPTRGNANKAFRLYRKSGADNAPDTAHIWKARRKLSPHYATSQNDVVRRGDGSKLVRVSYLGIWDTVGALGIPEAVLGPVAAFWNARYRFHDTRLSHLVEAARHAVALDERRVFFVPSLWDNLEAAADGPGLNQGDRTATRPYQQIWFVGDHAIVGGSAAAEGLTSLTLDWIVEGAQSVGLMLGPDAKFDKLVRDPIQKTMEIDDPALVYRIARGLLRWRKGPGHAIDLHPSVRQRTAADAGYRPQSLRNLMKELF